MLLGKDFESMFGNAQEFIPDPADITENEFDTLDEEDAGGEEDLDEIDCSGISLDSEGIESSEKETDLGEIAFDSLSAGDFNLFSEERKESETPTADAGLVQSEASNKL